MGLYYRHALLKVVYRSFFINNVKNTVISRLTAFACQYHKEEVLREIEKLSEKSLGEEISDDFIRGVGWSYDVAVNIALKISNKYTLMLDYAYKEDPKLAENLILEIIKLGISKEELAKMIENDYMSDIIKVELLKMITK